MRDSRVLTQDANPCHPTTCQYSHFARIARILAIQTLHAVPRLESQQKAIDVARREYESARAEFYEVPTDEGRKTAMLGIEVGVGVDWVGAAGARGGAISGWGLRADAKKL